MTDFIVSLKGKIINSIQLFYIICQNGGRAARHARHFLLLHPRNVQLLFMLNAVGQIKVNQCLVGNTRFFCLFFEIVNDCAVNIDRYLFLEFLRVGVFSRIQAFDIKFIQH